MFLPVKNDQSDSALPPGTGFAESDWAILAGFWHPVARAQDIADKPVAARLFDRRFVIWRGKDGIRVAKDLCMHRCGQLTMGTVRDGSLTCPLHGFRYDGSGGCTKIPALAEGMPIPPKLRLETCLTKERYGLVWVCLAETPSAPLPEWPEIEDGIGTIALVPQGLWHASAARHVENFDDLCHIPFVHQGTFGGEEDRTIEPCQVSITDHQIG